MAAGLAGRCTGLNRQVGHDVVTRAAVSRAGRQSSGEDGGGPNASRSTATLA
jgi:hypothetical protein